MPIDKLSNYVINLCKQLHYSLFFPILTTLLMIFTLMTFTAVANASVPSWQILPKESALTFTVTFNNAPFTGEFKTFTGEIVFDPSKLNESRVKIIVDMTSINTAYPEISEILKAGSWFNTKNFPKAIFNANHFSKIDDRHYKANGSLVICNRCLPILLQFIAESIADNKVKVTGSTVLKTQSVLGVNQQDESLSRSVKDHVKVDFIITAEKKQFFSSTTFKKTNWLLSSF